MRKPLQELALVVTGASRGIGRAIAEAASRAGAQVLGLSRRRVGLTGVVELQLDLCASDSADRAVEAAERAFGRAPDVLVNNAGAFVVAPVAGTTPDAFDRVVALNLAVPFRLARAFLPGMRARGSGHIVTIGSVADHVAFPGNAAYAASKFGLRGLHGVLRSELGGTGVRATLISPGAVDTPLWDSLDADTRATFPAAHAMLRPADVADAVVFAITRPAAVSVDELRLSSA